MSTRIASSGSAGSGLAAYEQQRATALPEPLPAAAARKQRSFSFGPLTLRYEEEESFDFGALARAAAAQINKVRRFNFAEALQTETARAELPVGALAHSGLEAGAADASAAYVSDAALARASRRAASALADLTYGADGRLKQAQLYFPADNQQAGQTGQGLSGEGALVTAKTREALTAYLTADRAARGAPLPGRLLSGQV